MPKSRSRGKANSNYSRDHKMFSTCHLPPVHLGRPAERESRQATWQLSNKDYLEQRAKEMAA